MKKKHFILISLFFLLFYSTQCIAQPKKPPSGTSKTLDPAEAKEHFKHKNYLWAIPVYKQLIRQEPNNVDYQHKLGICYLNTNINKTLAIGYLEKARDLNTNTTDKTIFMDLALAYQYSSRFDDAIATYKLCLKGAAGKDKENIEHLIETCENGKEYVKHPVNVTFENLGPNINTEYPDYYPFVSLDGSTLVFTSRRKTNIGGSVEVDGYYSSDIYICNWENGAWSKPKNLGGPINTRYDEQAVSISPDGKKIYIYMDRIDSLGNIYESTYNEKDKAFKRMYRLNANVNSDFETSGSVTPDGNTIFFASKREGGLGETDIYMSRKLPNGQWGKAQNLGKTVNTVYKEDFPEIAPDGVTLYFSSQGHDGMGDFDLFTSTWNPDENTWTVPKNLGYPVNTVGEERCISFTKDNKVAYISSAREGGFGDLDIYKITFKDNKNFIIQNYLRTVDSAKTFANATVQLEHLDNKNEEPDIYTPNPKTGKFIMSLNPGKYKITINCKGYKTYTKEFAISEDKNDENEIVKRYTLQR
jgi:tetratricopeptide (TPR) repeat protein